MPALLETEGLTVRYGALRAVDDFSLQVQEGEFVGLIGPNGAGKTTFIDGVTGLTPASGRIHFAGERIDGRPPHRRARQGLGRTFQSLELFEELTVRENLLVSAERARWWSPVVDVLYPRLDAAAPEDVDAPLELLGLLGFADALPGDLSLGQRKLVTVARGLALRPRLLLLDEPAAGLDSRESLALGEALKKVVAGGTALLLVDHDMGLVLSVCDRIYVLEFGKLIATGTPAEIRRDDRVIHAYLGAGAIKALAEEGRR
jgi:ABC-type branched-subunit amino acid transport system ATPase component